MNDIKPARIAVLLAGLTLGAGLLGALAPERHEGAKLVAYVPEALEVHEPYIQEAYVPEEYGTPESDVPDSDYVLAEEAPYESSEEVPLFPISEDRDIAAASEPTEVEDAPATLSACPIEAGPNATVVDFTTHEDTRPLRADGARSEAERMLPVVLSPGTYSVTVALKREAADDVGRMERVVLKLYDEQGTLIATTSPTSDLVAGETTSIERLREELVLDVSAAELTVRHAAFSSPEPSFLSVTCITFAPADREASGPLSVEQGSPTMPVVAYGEATEAVRTSSPVAEAKGTQFTVEEYSALPAPEAVAEAPARVPPQSQTAAAGSAPHDTMRLLLPLIMLAFSLAGLMILGLGQKGALASR